MSFSKEETCCINKSHKAIQAKSTLPKGLGIQIMANQNDIAQRVNRSPFPSSADLRAVAVVPLSNLSREEIRGVGQHQVFTKWILKLGQGWNHKVYTDNK